MIHSCQQCEGNEDDECWRHGITSLVLFVSDPLLQWLLAYVSYGILLSLRELTTLLRLRRSSIFILKYTDGRRKRQWVNALFSTHQWHCEGIGQTTGIHFTENVCVITYEVVVFRRSR
jgi:hypothetical protein